jgi:putative transposase
MSRIARRVRQAGIYFITTDTWERRRLFRKPDPARIVTEQIIDCRERGLYELHAFVLMPEHLHLLITPSEDASIEKAVMMIKGGSSYRIKKELSSHVKRRPVMSHLKVRPTNRGRESVGFYMARIWV